MMDLRGHTAAGNDATVVTGLAAATDQVVKALIVRWVSPDHVVDVVDGLFALRLGLNTGVAFGLLAGVPEAWRWAVGGLPIFALLLLLHIAGQVLPEGGHLPRIAFGLVFGGALGNLVDRARLGGVVDFIDLFWRDYHWPAFNLADTSITVGVGLLAWSLTRSSAASGRGPCQRDGQR